MSRFLRIALVGAAFAIIAVAIYSCSTIEGLTGGKSGSEVKSNGFSTDLIAGDGRGNGPGNGVDTGDITFTDNGNLLNIAVNMDDANDWSLGGLHIYIGDGQPTNKANGKPTVAPGQFPYTAADGMWTLQGDTWNGSFDISQFNGPLTIAVHGTGLHGGTNGLTQPSCQGVVNQYTLYYGANDVPCGTVTMSIVGNDIQVTVTMDSPYLCVEAHMWLDFDTNGPPPFAPGQWPYNSGNLGSGVTSYTFTVPLSTFGIDPQDPQVFADLMMAFHVSLTSGNNGAANSATAWNPDCRTHFLQGGGKDGPKPHWKSYTSCADIGPCDWVTTPPSDATEETLWACNDPVTEGWFPDNGFNRWGWFIYYQPQN